MNDVGRVALAGVVLGVVAGLVVWWLRRFEVEDFHSRWGSYLEHWDEFRRWESEHGGR